LQHDHPLTGVILETARQQAVGRGDLLAALRQADYVLLGEVHDHRDHHRLHAELLATLGSGRALVLEQFDRDHAAALAEAARRPGVTLDAVLEAGRFDRKAWRWPQHEPLLRTALAAGMPLVAGNLSRAEARRVYAEGWAAAPGLSAALVASTWNDARDAALRRDLMASHCGQLGASHLPGMVTAQRARDALIAQAVAAHPRAVLIAGNGHVRGDYGVPVYLRALHPGARILSVGFLETLPDAAVLRARAQPFDYVWFTARRDAPDPCAGVDFSRLKAG
jgi:uncharacterized iron-regulated protein